METHNSAEHTNFSSKLINQVNHSKAKSLKRIPVFKEAF